jgi:hypothetical protein
VQCAGKHRNIQTLVAYIGKILVNFKETSSVSSHEVGVPDRIPVNLRQQQSWKYASARRNFGTLWFRKLSCQNAAFGET